MSHPVTLLPWYQNGTLSAAERAEVAAHLQTCVECQAELDSLRAVRQQMHEALESDVRPSPAARRRVMQNIRPQPRTSSGGIGEMLRNLFAPKWAPAAALSLLAVQGGLLVWSLGEQPTQPQTAVQPPTTTLPPPQSRAVVGPPTVQMRVRFAPTATEAELRALLLEQAGRIVNGPAQDGSYLIEVVASTDERAERKLAALRARTTLVLEAHREPPPP